MKNKKKYSFQEIYNARKILDIPEYATRSFIESQYKEMVRKHHPDKQEKKNEKEMKEINKAYETINEFINNYAYSFNKNAVHKYNPDTGMQEQYGGDWNWGSKK